MENIFDTYFYLLENPAVRQLGICGERVFYQTSSFDHVLYSESVKTYFESRAEAYLNWLQHGRSVGANYFKGKNTVLKIVLKAKDEPELIDKWVDHHASIVGFENLIILDCGSEDPDYLEMLKKYENKILIFSYRKRAWGQVLPFAFCQAFRVHVVQVSLARAIRAGLLILLLFVAMQFLSEGVSV